MKLRALLAGTAASVEGPDDVEVSAIVNDSTKVGPGSLFVAIDGIARDGHDFLPQAIARGASVLVVEQPARVPPAFSGPIVVVRSGRDALNDLAARFFGDPGRSLFCVGVTGTDGKTSVTCLAEAVLVAGGVPTGVIGTVDHHLGEHRWPGDTTPPPLVLQERLAQLLRLGAQAVALEATSQGLSQARVSSVPLDVAVFTNLTRDHLDYHHTLDGYFEAKERLFTEALAQSPKRDRFAIVNVDTPYGARVRVPPGVTKWTYGAFGTGADATYEVLASDLSGGIFRLRGWGQEAELRLPMVGAFNGANALAALAVGVARGDEFASSVDALRGFRGVPGRMQRVPCRGARRVFVDYAHDPDAFEKVLGTVRDALRREERAGTEARVVTVFGCGGDRDRGKRPLMLAVARRLSHRVIVTLDNPRSEDPRAIVDDMFAQTEAASMGEEAPVEVELDRVQAIRSALAGAGDRDVVLLLGKGHETVQIIGHERVPHDDYAVAAAELERLHG